MPKVTVTLLEDGRVQLSGGTFDIRDQIRARGGRWDPAARVWILPAGTDTAFATVVVPPAPKPKPVPREEWTLAEWRAYVATHTRRGYIGSCCSHATGFTDAGNPYGPTHYRCERHGVTRSSYSGT